ncbi:MAG TPA: hypothetical protein VE969_09010 [Pyrinomonadaceae bacterium]|nr:hypothetical protein [Pyrinomonadaceae bacterium]
MNDHSVGEYSREKWHGRPAHAGHTLDARAPLGHIFWRIDC